jgi:transposase
VDTILNSSSANRRRRRHSTEFKKELIALCQPGVSISGVALAHGVNANLLRRWMKQFPVDAKFPVASTSARQLVPVQVETINTSPSDGDIQIDIQRGATRINIRWPMTGAEACAKLMGAWLK